MSQVFELSLEADLENLKAARSFIQRAGKALGVAENTIGDLCLVVDEAVTNVVLHGYEGRGGPVDIAVEPQGDALVIRIRDKARPFDGSHVDKPHLDQALAERAYGGMGVFLIRKLTDEAEFQPLNGGGNELKLVKRGVVPV